MNNKFETFLLVATISTVLFCLFSLAISLKQFSEIDKTKLINHVMGVSK